MKQQYSLSYLRAAACLAIVVLHTASVSGSIFGEGLSPTDRFLSHALVNLTMWAVPVFLMVTGALLLDKKRTLSYRKLFGKYVLRIGVVLVIFSLLYRTCDLWMAGEKLSAGGILTGIGDMFFGTSWVQMWYLYLLLGMYLLLPFYRMVVERCAPQDMWYFLLLQVIFLSLLPLLHIWDLESAFYIQTHTIYLYYVFCGYAVYHRLIRVPGPIGLLLFLLFSGVIGYLTYRRWIYGEEIWGNFFGYSSILVILQATGLFAWSASWREKAPGLWGRFCLQVDGCSFGIYMVHIIFVRLLFYGARYNPYQAGWPVFVGLVFGIFLASLLLVWLLRRIPGVKRWL